MNLRIIREIKCGQDSSNLLNIKPRMRVPGLFGLMRFGELSFGGDVNPFTI